MKTRKTRTTSKPLAALLLLPLLAQAQQSIGTVLAIGGQVSARAADGSVRPLARRADIFEGDTILTGIDGVAQLRLVDKAVFALGPGSELTFDRHVFDGNPATPDLASMTILRGCMRSVSGLIDAGSFRLDTPFASVAIEGVSSSGVRNPVTYEASVSSDALSMNVHGGSTVISNPLGSLALGVGGAYASGRAVSGMAPEGLVDAPFGLLDCTPQTNTRLPAGPDTDYRAGP